MLTVKESSCDPALRALGNVEKAIALLAPLVPDERGEVRDSRMKILIGALVGLRYAEKELHNYAGRKGANP